MDVDENFEPVSVIWMKIKRNAKHKLSVSHQVSHQVSQHVIQPLSHPAIHADFSNGRSGYGLFAWGWVLSLRHASRHLDLLPGLPMLRLRSRSSDLHPSFESCFQTLGCATRLLDYSCIMLPSTKTGFWFPHVPISFQTFRFAFRCVDWSPNV